MDTVIPLDEHAAALRHIANTGNLWPEAVEELRIVAQKLEAHADILAALEGVYAFYDDPTCCSEPLQDVLRNVRDALAKAEGQS